MPMSAGVISLRIALCETKEKYSASKYLAVKIEESTILLKELARHGTAFADKISSPIHFSCMFLPGGKQDRHETSPTYPSRILTSEFCVEFMTSYPVRSTLDLRLNEAPPVHQSNRHARPSD